MGLPLQYGKGITFNDPDVVRTVLSSFWLAAEPIRLWSGYYGNLQENVRRGFNLTVAAQHDLCCMMSLRCFNTGASNHMRYCELRL